MKEWKLSRSAIKYIAMVTMFLNHFNIAILNQSAPYSLALEYIGYFTAITMCYFLVEGYHDTHSKRKYALRMFLFALISQVPYWMAIGFRQFNMLFTLLLCMGVLWILENVQPPLWRTLGIVALIFCSIYFDWGILAPVFTLMFAKNRGNRTGVIRAYVIAAILFAGLNFSEYILNETPLQAFLQAVCSSLGIVVSGIVITCVYDKTKQPKKAAWSKWFFYAFYPAHLLVLGLIRLYAL